MPWRAPHELVSALIAGRHERAERLLGEIGSDPLRIWAAQAGMSSVVHDLARAGSPIREALHDDRLHDAADYLARQAWVGELVDAARARGIDVVAFKGCGVAHLPGLYDRPELRPLGDVDLLVTPEHAPAMLTLSRERGFALKHEDPAVVDYLTRVHYNASLVHPQHGWLEIHTDLYRDIPSPVTARMMERARPCEVYGRSLRTFDPSDLFIVLSVHLGITPGEPLWIWLEDLRRLGTQLSVTQWETIYERTVAAGEQMFVVLALRCLELLWSVVPPALPDNLLPRLDTAMSARERRALARTLEELPRLAGDRLSVARRLSGRPVRGNLTPMGYLVCHPGVVCLELGVRSDSSWFWWHRIHHIVHRARLAGAAVVGRGRTLR